MQYDTSKKTLTIADDTVLKKDQVEEGPTQFKTQSKKEELRLKLRLIH